MLDIVRTDSKNKDFIKLVKLLDSYLAEKDGDDHLFYDQFNKIDHLNYVIVAYRNRFPFGCGAIKEFSSGIIEVKRMFTQAEFRGQKIASIVLSELENWARELNYTKCILETGKKQIEAIELYKKNGYSLIPNYGQYQNVDNSLCFEKYIS
ncbi:MAG: GNAT family N-acetyltransferase [Chitinophagaceae bacterium]